MEEIEVYPTVVDHVDFEKDTSTTILNMAT